jgi:hypothetical protein
MFTEFTSSAIESISDITNDGKVDVIFNGGRKYTYGVSDVEKFVSMFNEATSKGQFINRALREDMLTQVAVWSRHGAAMPLPHYLRINMPTSVLVSMLRKGRNGSEIIQILDAIVETTDHDTTEEWER